MEMIYPVDMAVEMLLSSFTDENGELTCTEEEMIEAVEQLHMDFDKKIVSLRNKYKTLSLDAKKIEAEAKVLREEADSTQKRANALKNKAERTKRFIAYLLNGEEFKKDGCSIGYRTTEQCIVDDDFAEWALKNAPELLKVEPRKKEIANALSQGIGVDHARMEKIRSIQIR